MRRRKPDHQTSPGRVAYLLGFLLLLSPLAAQAAPTTQPLLLHLPGVGGYRWIDENYLHGLQKGGVRYQFEVYDWTLTHPGLDALHAYRYNLKQAQHVADILTARAHAFPNSPIFITGHSGGSAIAIWALERLPTDVHIQALFMLAPAISPMYDLSPALRHITGKAYSFNSLSDELVLGFGCRFCGTMDGVKTDAAGRVGFSRPPNGDAHQYAKLLQEEYDPAWLALGNIGDHIGSLAAPFAAQILAPLLQGVSDAVNAAAEPIIVLPTTLPAADETP